MITLKDWLEVVEYRISEGTEFYWKCFGDNAYCLSYWDQDHDGRSLNIVFDTKTQKVYCVEVCDYRNQRAYRLIDDEYREAHKQESESRNVIDNQAWDDVDFIDLETDEDWLEKASSIVQGIEYDTRVSIPLDIPENELMILFKAAHERDMTFNQFVEEALRELIKDFEQNPDIVQARSLKYKKSN